MKKENKRLSINIIAQVITFSVQMAISFFLTPFVVNKLGADAYGYIGLTDSFVMYAQIIIIALNSMAGRFVTIAYHQKKIEEANKLFSSVFYANIFLTVVIMLISLCCVGWLEYLINIPDTLITDVKALFSLMFLNFMVSVTFSTYQLATFIKNRLELNAIRSIIANIARVSILLVCFGLFVPHLWYMGLAAVVSSLYIAYTNIRYTKKLTPELNVEIHFFDFSKIKTLISAGIWNAITKLGNLIGQGLDLLFANLLIGSIAMGYLAITKRIPIIILGLVASICAAFAPSLTELYAKNKMEDFKDEILFSIKFAGFIAIIPSCFIFSLGDKFYSLWIPNQDTQMLYLLTIIGTLCNPIAMSLEGVQNVFTITNKVRIYSYFALGFNLAMFLSLVIGLRLLPFEYRIYYLAFVHSFWAFFRVVVFLPIYGARCIGESIFFFYPNMLKVVVSLIASLLLMLTIKNIFIIDSWGSLFAGIVIVCVICTLCGGILIFSKEERMKVIRKTKLIKSRNI